MAANQSTARARRSQTSAPPVTPAPVKPLVGQVPSSLIDPPSINPREFFPDDDIRSLASSIEQVGLLEPLLVRPQGDRYELVAGERRWRAITRLGWREVPAVVRELDDRQAAECRLLENLDRKSLNPLEEAAALRELRRLGHTTESLASLVRRTAGELEACEGLLTLPEAWRERVRTGKISAAAAEYLLPWVNFPSILKAMESAVCDWPMPLGEWRRRIVHAVHPVSRNMDPAAPDGPKFTPTAEQRERLDVRDLTLRNGWAIVRAMNARLWDELQDLAEQQARAQAAEQARPTTPATNGRSPAGAPARGRSAAATAPQAASAARVSSPAARATEPAPHVSTAAADERPASKRGPSVEPFIESPLTDRVAAWKASWLRSKIADQLARLELAELEELAEHLVIDLAAEWRLQRSFLLLLTEEELRDLADELGVDVTPATERDEVIAVLLHADPPHVPSCIVPAAAGR